MRLSIALLLILNYSLLLSQNNMEWVRLDGNSNQANQCNATSDCFATVPEHCYSLIFTPTFVDQISGNVSQEDSLLFTSYTTFFRIDCASNNEHSVVFNESCIMTDNSTETQACPAIEQRFNSSGNSGAVFVKKDSSYIMHTICFQVPLGDTLEVVIRELPLSPVQSNASLGTSGNAITEALDVANLLIISDMYCDTTPPIQDYVGINETDPKQMLHVNGAILIGDDDPEELGSIRFRNNQFEGYNILGWQAFNDADTDPNNERISSFAILSNDIILQEGGNSFSVDLSDYENYWTLDGSNNLRYFNGNVTIGSNSLPSDKLTVVNGGLDVVFNSQSQSPHIDLKETSTSDGARINFTHSSTSNLWTLYGFPSTNIASSRFNIFHNSSGNIVSITGDGNVGINGGPNTDLHVIHKSDDDNIGFKIQNSDTDDWIRMYVSESDGPLLIYSTK
ncbi:MAG: hypothetical protein AAGK97_13075, partial [Bacteroidota bacterium]